MLSIDPFDIDWWVWCTLKRFVSVLQGDLTASAKALHPAQSNSSLSAVRRMIGAGRSWDTTHLFLLRVRVRIDPVQMRAASASAPASCSRSWIHATGNRNGQRFCEA
jgi:hypothetical protein